MFKFITSLILGIICANPIYAKAIKLSNKKFEAYIEPETLSVSLVQDSTKWDISLPQTSNIVSKLNIKDNAIEFNINNIAANFTLEEDGLLITFISNSPSEIQWPRIDFKNKNLVLPYQDGRFIKSEDTVFWNFLHHSEFNVISLSMPFIASNSTNGTIIWIFRQPHRNHLTFTHYFAEITHEFVSLSNQKPYIIKVLANKNKDEIEAARIYRKEVIKNTKLISLEKKAIKNPKLNILPGALHAYLWGNGYIAFQDVKNWTKLIKTIADNNNIYNQLNSEANQIFKKIQNTQNLTLDRYQKSIIIDNINAILLNCSHKTRNSYLELFKDSLNPNTKHGQAISCKMLDNVKAYGVDKARLVLVDAMDGTLRPEVAVYADKIGYLFGPYDSYDSIHDPKDKNTDNSWSTAQFEGNLYEIAGMINKNGNFYKGFNQIGKIPNPKVIETLMKKRIQENLKVGYNSYFLDVDAAGEYRDDYSLNHKLSAEENVACYKERLKWLQNKELIVGSEKGIAEFVDVIDIAEGATSYPFYWMDRDFKDPKSKYYIGKYWPKDEPTMFFKIVPLKENFFEIQYNPIYKIPLYEYVFHDYVVPTDHWDVPIYKFKDIEKLRILTHILYQTAPIYHLNIDSLNNNKFLKSYFLWKDLNKELAFKSLDDFKYLTSDRQVAETKFGQSIITVNFKNEKFEDIPPMSAKINHNDSIKVISP